MKPSTNTHVHLSHPVVMINFLKIFSVTSYYPINKKNKRKRQRGSKETNDTFLFPITTKMGITWFTSWAPLKYVNGRNVRVSTNFKIRSHPSATTEDLIDYVKLKASKKPTIMVIHTRTNDPLNV